MNNERIYFSGDEILTNFVILNKFSIEKLKQHLDMYYSLRSVLSDLFFDKNYKSLHMQVAINNM